jgi:hypothetical protein
MLGSLRKLFGSPAADQPVASPYGERDNNPVAVVSIMGAANEGPKGVASAHEGEQAKSDFDRFYASFYFRSETKLMDFLEAEGVTRLKSWFHWSTPDAEPKAIMRLMLELTRQGMNIWDQPGISLYLDGRWSQGGGPSSESQAALSVLAQILEKPIKVYYRQKPSEPIMVAEFRP